MKNALAKTKLALTIAFVFLFSGIGMAQAAGADFAGSLLLGNSKAGGYVESITAGGSSAVGGTQGNAYTKGEIRNAGDSYAVAGAHLGGNEIKTYTSGGSHSFNEGKGEKYGDGAFGSTNGGVGSDYSGKAWGDFGAQKFTASGDARWSAF